MSQWSRSKPRSVAASARCGERLVIPWTTSTVLTPLIVRSVRFSIRPCPLSTVAATRSAEGGGRSSGGSGRRDTSGGGLEGEPGPDVAHQAGLVVLGNQQVIPSGLD